jgi:hypothetical protein
MRAAIASIADNRSRAPPSTPQKTWHAQRRLWLSCGHGTERRFIDVS